MEVFEIEWRTSAAKELRRIDRQFIPKIVEAIGRLALDSHPHGSVKLQGIADTYRIRVGDYRVVYEVDLDARKIIS